MKPSKKLLIPSLTTGLILIATGSGGARHGGAAVPASQQPQTPLPVEVLASPAAAWSSQPNLSLDAAGNVYLVWVERAPGAPVSIKFSRFDGSRWSPARPIVSTRAVVASSADIPSIVALPGGRLVAHWLQPAAPGARGWGVRVAQSTDGGTTWSDGVIPHVTHETGENGFVSFFPQRGDSAGLAWLDGRNFARGDPSATRETMLVTTRIAANGAVAKETVLDSRVCDCCQTSYTLTTRGPVIAYRDRTAEEIRDISVVQFVNGSWSAPRAVHDDGWRMASCPVNGPAIAAMGDKVAVGWFTAARDSARVLVAFSDDAALRFGRPVRVDTGDPTGKVGIAMFEPGTAWVSWLERVAGNTLRFQARRVSAAGLTSPAYEFAAPELANITGFPQMVQRQGALYIAWSVAAAGGVPPMVKVGRAQVSGR